MPSEAGYQPQVAPTGAVPLPDASPASFGAGIGASLEQLGNAAHEADLKAYKLDRDQQTDAQAADFNARFAAARLAADKTSVDARNNAAPGGAGHADQMAQYWQGKQADLLGGITDARLRSTAAEQLNEFGTRFQSAEYQWQEGSRIGKVTTDTAAATDAAANRAYTAHDPQSFSEELSLGRQAIEAMPNVPSDVKDKLARQHDQTVTDSYARGVIATNPAGAKSVLDSGLFDTILEPRQLEQLRGQADTAQRRQDAIAEHQAAVAKAAANDQIATVKAKSAAGIQLTPAELTTAESNAAGLGKGADIVQVRALHVQDAVNQVSQVWTPQQYADNIQTLEAKGKARTADEDVTLQQLRQIAPGRIAAIHNDPYTWAAPIVGAVPPIDPRNPASIAARQSAQTRISALTHLPTPFLQPQEVASFKALWGQGADGRDSALDELALFGPSAGTDAVRQVAPNDAIAQRLVTLPSDARRIALEGARARKANIELVDGGDVHGQLGTTKQSAAAFSRSIGTSLAGLNPATSAAILDTARSIQADYQAKTGAKFTPDQFGTSIHMALGGTRDASGQFRGGLGDWHGVPVLLPPTMTRDDFQAQTARLSWAPGSSNAPVFRGSGAVMTPEQVKSSYVPQLRPDGRYQFVGAPPPGSRTPSVLMDKNHRSWTLSLDAHGWHR